MFRHFILAFEVCGVVSYLASGRSACALLAVFVSESFGKREGGGIKGFRGVALWEDERSLRCWLCGGEKWCLLGVTLELGALREGAVLKKFEVVDNFCRKGCWSSENYLKR